MKMQRKPEEYSSVQKAIEILLAFSESHQEIGVMELSERLNLHKSTVSRLLHILTRYELLQQDKRSKKFTLGKAAFDLGTAAKRYIDSQLMVAAQSLLSELRNRVGELVALEVMSGNTTTVVCHAASTLPVTVSTDIGRRLPVHAVAGAKSILAFLPPEDVDMLLGNSLTAFTPHTITDPKVFKRQLKEIKKKGFSLDLGEYYPDVKAIGAPVFNSDGTPIAAVVMPVPAYRMEGHLRSGAANLVRDIASRISARLFFLEEEGNGKIHCRD